MTSPRETRGLRAQSDTIPTGTYVSHEKRLYLCRSVGQNPNMVPSPSSKRESARRLPSYLRGSGAEPVGELRRLRDEAVSAAQARALHQPVPSTTVRGLKQKLLQPETFTARATPANGVSPLEIYVHEFRRTKSRDRVPLGTYLCVS